MKNSNDKWQLICKVLKPLAYSERLEVLCSLVNKYQSIDEISAKSDQCPEVVSDHLRILHKIGLVSRNKRGQHVYYKLEPFSCQLGKELSETANCISQKQFRS